MRKLLPAFILLFFFAAKAQAQTCNPAFTATVNGATVQVQAANTSPNVFHNWKFGDGGQGWGANTSHTYNAPGTYVIKHIVVDSFNTCRDSATQTVVISFPVSCQASFTSVQDSIVQNRFNFYSTSTISGGTINSYNWTVNGNSVSGGSGFNYVLPQGSNIVCLTITTTAGCTSSTCDSIQVDSSGCNLNPSFTKTVNGATVQVQAANTSPGVYHNWKFGDGGQGWGASTSHTYNAPGTYVIRHIIVDSFSNCRDSSQQTVVISFPASCQAAFSSIADSILQNHYSFFSTSTASGGTINSYNWKVNGNTVSTSSAFSYVLPQGNSIVCLTITTTAGCTSSTCDSIFVNTPGACNWNASFTSWASPSNPKLINFVPSPISAALKYKWNFGDGFTSTVTSPSHLYATAGFYNVTLVITDSASNCRDTAVQTIQVHGSPADSCNVSFTWTANPSQLNQVTFTASSNQTFATQYWSIYPMDSATNPSGMAFYSTFNPTHTFTTNGTYIVCLWATTTTGCIRYTCDSLLMADAGRSINVIPSYPNPANGSEVNVQLTLTGQSKVKLTVYNTSGNVVYTQDRVYAAGSNRISIPVEKLQRGQYFIDIQYGNERKRSIFQKL